MKTQRGFAATFFAKLFGGPAQVKPCLGSAPFAGQPRPWWQESQPTWKIASGLRWCRVDCNCPNFHFIVGRKSMKNFFNPATMRSVVAFAAVSAVSVVSTFAASPPDPLASGTSAPCATQSQGQDGSTYERIVLVHRFTLPQKLAWGKVSIDLAPAAWRIGSVDGPPAHAAQLQGALVALGGIEIGGRCTGWVDGPTAYPCGFALREIGFTALTVNRHGGIVMDWTPDPKHAQAAIDARQHADMKGLMTPLRDTQRFVGMHVAPYQLGDPAKAVGRKLEFEIRAVSNQLMPSLFDHASGLVSLCGAGQKLAM
jgi:hypothetical protein